MSLIGEDKEKTSKEKPVKHLRVTLRLLPSTWGGEGSGKATSGPWRVKSGESGSPFPQGHILEEARVPPFVLSWGKATMLAVTKEGILKRPTLPCLLRPWLLDSDEDTMKGRRRVRALSGTHGVSSSQLARLLAQAPVQPKGPQVTCPRTSVFLLSTAKNWVLSPIPLCPKNPLGLIKREHTPPKAAPLPGPARPAPGLLAFVPTGHTPQAPPFRVALGAGSAASDDTGRRCRASPEATRAGQQDWLLLQGERDIRAVPRPRDSSSKNMFQPVSGNKLQNLSARPVCAGILVGWGWLPPHPEGGDASSRPPLSSGRRGGVPGLASPAGTAPGCGLAAERWLPRHPPPLALAPPPGRH
ncbi:uncharacterized protein LOC120582717 [Pteropus medius]|uniref:uncharacterized protein LOC120582717 n=1 Tax=Pteropus vampyrus TaxID=132908 RepID=UPI00196A7E61|nr:uncharacterized protein LOC120582717 [Pteropus giganteus]